ncbi:MAG TPA: tetratricopeptide repeat protein [Treponemataceae bacterium]|nr:tetratricopeptide repeat protein [Treponemataceae bacterium]
MTLFQFISIALLIATVIFLIYLIAHFFVSPARTDNINSLLKQGKTAQAIKLAKRLLSKDPQDYQAHYYLGKAYLADNRPELALMEYKFVNQHAIFSPNLPERAFRKELANLYQEFNQDKEALKEYILLTKLEPANSDVFFNAGNLFEKTRKTDLAITYYDKAIILNRRNAQAHSAKGRLLYKIKKYQEAKKEIEIAISQSPNLFSNYYYLGKILKEAKDFAGAINAFEKSLRAPEYKQRSYIERGSCYMGVKQADKAIIEFEKAVSATKNNKSQETLYARYFLAATYEQQHKLEKALKQWEQIYIVNNNFLDVATKLATYRDLHTNDNMKEYLTSNVDEFLAICKRTAEQAMDLNVKQCNATKFGCQMLTSESSKNNWMHMREQLILLLFYREPDLIEDTVPRKMLEDIKKHNCIKGIICTSSGFTRTAKNFVENRPVELVDRAGLEKYLSKIL